MPVGTIKVNVEFENVNTEYREKLNEVIAAEHIEIDHDPDLEILQTMVAGLVKGGGVDAHGKIVYQFDWKELHNAYLDELGLV